MNKYLLFAFISRALSVGVILHANVCALNESTTTKLLALPGTLTVFFSNSSWSQSRVFREARSRSSIWPDLDGFVVVDCASEKIGLAFNEYYVGMDCGVQKISELRDQVDAYKTNEFIGDTLHVVEYASSAWRRARDCEPYSDYVYAAFFWTTISLLTVLFRAVRASRPKSVQKGTPST